MRASQNFVIALGRRGRSDRSLRRLQDRLIMRNLAGASLCLFVSLMIACSSSDPNAGDPSPADPAGDNADTTAGDISSQVAGKWATATYYQQQPRVDGYPHEFELSLNTQVAVAGGAHVLADDGAQYSCAPSDPNYTDTSRTTGKCLCIAPLGTHACVVSCSPTGTWNISGVKQTSSYYQGTLTLAMDDQDYCSGALTAGKTYRWLFDFDPHPSYDDRPTLKLYKANDSVHGGDGHEWDYEMSPAM
jgi:hypothetical protein